MAFSHTSVLLHETVDALSVKPEGVYVDCTLGGGGHAEELLSRLTTGRLIAFDQDEEALAAAGKRLERFQEKLTLVHSNFENAGEVLKELAPHGIDGAMMDLGVSSHQLDTPERGFSYHSDAPLDMRMDQNAARSAKDVVNGATEVELSRILWEYGEEKNARRIAHAIVEARKVKEIETTSELTSIIKSAFRARDLAGEKHPARRSFQAIRIEVNRELEVIPRAIDGLVSSMKKGGRLAVITFHSLEDRLVKESIRKYSDGCTCPPDFPVCVCGFRRTLKPITAKPIIPSAHEIEQNARSRSAKLRVAEKV